MQKNLLWKTIFIIAVMLVFVAGIIGIPEHWSASGIKESMLSRIHLGLDLKGGTHLILQVKVDDAVRAEADSSMQRLRERLAKDGVGFTDIASPDPASHPDQIVVKGVSPDNGGKFRSAVDDLLRNYERSSGPEGSFVLNMNPSALKELRDRTVQQSIETIRSRVDTLGVSEPVIEEHGLGQYQILVQLPGVDDPERVKDIMQSTAMLEIRQAIDPTPYPTEEAALQAQAQRGATNSIVLRGVNPSPSAGEEQKEVFYVVSRSSVVAGRDIRDAEPGRKAETGAPIVNFYLTNDGGRRFSIFTGAHVNDSLAVVLDNKVREVANIKSQMSDSGYIEGGFTEQSAKDLSMLLRSGALPAGINYLEERTVGPSLGADSIKEGVRSAIIGMSVVMLFMLFYYRFAGINADLALILNLVILLGFLGFSQATLTLPGIAGVILTIGMGVDSNVLIFERIREELRNGKSPAAAVDQGFSKAFVTIVDTHVTTIVSAFILFIFGTGPVQGFAVTLTFGLLANVFTAVFVSRVIFDFGLQRKQRGEALSI